MVSPSVGECVQSLAAFKTKPLLLPEDACANERKWDKETSLSGEATRFRFSTSPSETSHSRFSESGGAETETWRSTLLVRWQRGDVPIRSSRAGQLSKTVDKKKRLFLGMDFKKLVYGTVRILHYVYWCHTLFFFYLCTLQISISSGFC